VCIGGQCASDAEPIRSRLLLRDRPGRRTAVPRLTKKVHHGGPLNTGFHVDDSLLRIKVENSGQRPRVHEFHIRSKLLTARRVTAARDTDRPPFALRIADDALDIIEGSDGADATNERGIQLGVDIIHQDTRAPLVRCKTSRSRRQR
jgi:hypothetical protein